MDNQIAATAAKFLRYLFTDIDFNYKCLTPMEKGLCTEAEFNAMVEWVKAQ